MRWPLRRHRSQFGFQWDLPAYLVLFAGLLALSCIDIERLLLPKRIVYPLTGLVAALLVLAAALTGQWGDSDAVLCAIGLVCGVLRDEPHQPTLLGFGDVRLALVLGLSLGWLGVGYVLLGFFAANVFGAVIGLGLIATKHMDSY